MPTIARLNNLRICVFGGTREHRPPHCHLKGPNSDCKIDLITLEVTIGTYTKRDFADAQEWLSDPKNLADVLNVWRRLNERE